MALLKDPDAILDYAFNWALWLGTDVISTSTWILDTGLTKVSDTNTSTLATVWISGGTAGATYNITNRITTAGGRTEDRSFSIRCQQR